MALKEDPLLPLKMLVVFLGIALVGGVLFLGATLYTRGHDSKQHTQTSHDPQASVASTSCTGGTLDIPSSDIIDTIMKDGNILTLVTKTEENQQAILLIDYCANRIISTINFKKPASAQIQPGNNNLPPALPPPAKTADTQPTTH